MIKYNIKDIKEFKINKEHISKNFKNSSLVNLLKGENDTDNKEVSSK